MKLHKNYILLIDALSSSQWSERTDALESIKKINDSDTFFSIFQEIEKRDDSNLRFQFLVIFEKLLKSDREDLSGVAIFALVIWKERDNTALATKSSHIMNEYIHSPQILRYLKIKSVRFAWKKVPLSKRHALTDVISKNQLKELSSNLISNFLINDEKLWIKTIKTLVRFRDKRVVRSVKKILRLNNSNDELTAECINALGVLGSIWEYSTVRRYFKHQDPLVQIIAVRSFSLLTGNYGVTQLNKIIRDSVNEKVKGEAIARLGRINTKRSCSSLIALLLERPRGYIGLYIDSALHHIDNKVKIPMLIDSFYKVSAQERMTILNFLADIYDTRIASFILKILNSNENEMIKVMAINLSSSFPSSEIISMLERYTLEFDGLISYTAMIELYDINQLSNSTILNTFFKKSLPIDNLCHHVVLKRLEDKKNSTSVIKFVPTYIETFLSSERNDLKFLAINICEMYTNNSIVTMLIDLALNKLSENLSKASKRSLAKIAHNEPKYLSKMNMLLSDDYFISALSEEDFTTSLVNELSILTARTNLAPSIEFNTKLVEYLEIISRQNFDKIYNLDLFFSMIIQCGIEFSTFILDDFLLNIYPRISLDNKKLFLQYIAYNPESRYTDFFFYEVIAHEGFCDLLNVYMSNFAEVVNE